MPVISLPTPLHTMALPDLESELLGLAGHLAAAQCRFLQLLAEFDHRNGWAGDGIRSCAHWLSWRAGMSLRTAVEHLPVAHALRNLPQITAAFAAGRISYSKVRAITRIAGTDTATPTRIATEIATDATQWRHTTVADPATAEHVLLTVALHGTASHVETVVRAVRRRHTPPDDLAARRSLTWQWDEDGSLIVRARLTPDSGAALIAAIDAQVPAPSSHPVPAPAEDLHQQAREQEPGPATDRVAARRADALLALINGHTPIHDHGYQIQRLTGRWEFRRPDGTTIPTISTPLTGHTEELIEMNTRARLRIDHTTLTPDWYGERLDPEPILDALLPRRIKTAA